MTITIRFRSVDQVLAVEHIAKREGVQPFVWTQINQRISRDFPHQVEFHDGRVLATVREAAERDLDRAERVFAATVDRMLRDVAATDARILTGVLKRLGKDACKHPGYITHGRNGYPYDGDCGPYCPACDAAVEL